MPVTLRGLVPVVALCAATLSAALAAGAAGPATRPLTFLDKVSDISISVQLDPAAADAGRFAFRVPGRGAYLGTLGDAMRRNADHSTTIHYRGPATLGPLVSLDGAGADVRRPLAVTIELQAQLDPVTHGGQAVLRDGGRRYHLVAPPRGTAGIIQALRRLEDAVLADDPHALYALMSADLRAQLTADAFAALWRSQGAGIGRVTALRRTALSEARVNELGYTYAVATYGAERITPAGTSSSATFEVFLVREGADWSVLFSRQP